MFKDLLQALASDRPRTMAELATELGTDAEGLRRAIDHCERMGYLERTSSGLSVGCSGSCGKTCGCGETTATCGASTSAAWWQVTDRGRRAARLAVVRS
jgi:predicted ArsR family transcriptional regulator